ncbi:hypothetical protein BDZ45DRAFT_681625 [Acephala macrosclerotiorum]|nr:hypothetical protein BDZ45DRAFT_681625 [Acephala macrosclerotiorum]
MSLITTPQLAVLWHAAQAKPEYAAAEFWQYALKEHYFKGPEWSIAPEQPPTEAEGDLRRVDKIIKRFRSTSSYFRGVVLVELKRQSATQKDIDEVEYQAFTACCAFLHYYRLDTVWAMTAVGTAARIWFYNRGETYLTPFIPPSQALGARSDYIEANSPEANQLSAAFRHINKHNSPTTLPSNSTPSPRPRNATLPFGWHDHEVEIVAGLGDYGYDPATSGVASTSTDMGSTGYSQALTDSAGPSNYTPGHEYPFEGNPDASTYSGISQEALLVETFVVEKNRHVFYHFYNEEGQEVKTEASDWEKGSRYAGEKVYDCLVYTGKKSRKVYNVWQHGTGEDKKGKGKIAY